MGKPSLFIREIREIRGKTIDPQAKGQAMV
jgi:hypothetical protein